MVCTPSRPTQVPPAPVFSPPNGRNPLAYPRACQHQSVASMYAWGTGEGAWEAPWEEVEVSLTVRLVLVHPGAGEK